MERVAAVVRERGADVRLEEFSRGHADRRGGARDAVGCEPSQIVKSIVFVCDGAPVLALVPGDRRADPAKVAAAADAGYARIARPDEVRRRRPGFEPGAVAPFPAPNVAPRAARARAAAAGDRLGRRGLRRGTWPGSRRSTSLRLAGAMPVDLAET